MPLALKKTLIRPIPKKPNLVADDINNYRRVASVPFISKLVKRVVSDQLQVLLEETNALDPFHVQAMSWQRWHWLPCKMTF